MQKRDEIDKVALIVGEVKKQNLSSIEQNKTGSFVPKALCWMVIPPLETGHDQSVERLQRPNRFWQEFPALQFSRQQLGFTALEHVDDGDEEEEGGDGDEDDVDGDGAGQREEEDDAGEDEEHSEKINESKPTVFRRCVIKHLKMCQSHVISKQGQYLCQRYWPAHERQRIEERDANDVEHEVDKCNLHLMMMMIMVMIR